MLGHYFLNKFKKRKGKSAMIFTSSGMGWNYSPCVIVYTATKALITSLVTSVAYENRNFSNDSRIDI
jgi:short-subunit dehydrogenase